MSDAAASPSSAPNAAPAPAPAPAAPRRSLAQSTMLAAAFAVLLGFIGFGVSQLWGEWQALRAELTTARVGTVVGYPGITPQISHAGRPIEWVRNEGDSVMLWSGWRDGQGHQWFRLAAGDVDVDRVSHPLGRDVVRAIDFPIVEQNGGAIWNRIPDEAAVVGQHLGDEDRVYPVIVLQKVFVVNDQIGDQPYLVVFNPFSTAKESVTIYKPRLDGVRVTMGTAGYLHDRSPMLYDRGTESLWVAKDGELKSVSGPHKGHSLKQVARVAPMPWSDWRSGHPKSRLVVGAARDRPSPAM